MSEMTEQKYPSRPVVGGPTKPDPGQRLEDLKRQMAQEESELSKRTRNRDSLKADVSDY